jgi:hypothetical protein
MVANAAPGTCAQKAWTHVRKTQPSPIPVYLSLCVSLSLFCLSESLSLFCISLSLFCLSQSLSVSFVSLSVSFVSLGRSQSLPCISLSLFCPSQSLSVSLVSLCLSESLLCLSVSLSPSCVSLSLWVSLVCLCLSESLLLSLYLFIYYSVETGKQLGEGANGWDSDALEGQAISSSKELESQLDASPSSASRQLLSTKKLYGLTRWSQFGNNPWIIPEFFKLK